MRDYELMLIVRSNLDEKGSAAVVEGVVELIKANDGDVAQAKMWGRRKLAYPIDNQTEGIYALLKLTVAPAAIKEIEFNLKLNESLLRYMFVKDDGINVVEELAETSEEAAGEEPVLEEEPVAEEAVSEEEPVETPVSEEADTEEPSA